MANARHARFKLVLDSEDKAREALHDGMVNWRIPGATAGTKVAVATDKAPDKVICKRVQQTDSLMPRPRECMIAREWGRQADQYRDEYGAMRRRQGSTNSQ